MRPAVIAAALYGALGGATILAVVACSSTRTGSPPAADAGQEAGQDPADASDGAAPLPYPLDQVCAPATDPSLDACGKCARESCCNTRTRLVGNDAGNQLIDCLQQTSCESTCQATCFDQAPNETAPFLEHFSCLSHRCSECGIARSPCELCMEKNCVREAIACDLSRDCFVISSCITACKGADACVTECGKRYPGAGPLNGAMLVCASNLCASECQ